MNRNGYLLTSAGIVLLAFAVREWFVLTALIPNPTQGDVSAYLRYAMHMALDGTFSQAMPPAPTVPDAFRSPGYPALLALLYLLPWDWYSAIHQAQVVLGAATVGCVIALGRQFMSAGWALMAGGLLAVQPHHVAATGAMLTEVLFGFTLAAGLLAAAVAMRRRSMPMSILAGAILGYAYLVNPVAAVIPPLLALVFWREGLARHALALALVAFVAVGGWAARNAAVDAQGDERAAINFVQGSWPEYHDLWKWGWRWPAKAKAHDAEVELIQQDREAGIQAVAERLSQDPTRYAHWYLSHKPFLLWDWEVRIGHGMAYTLEMRDTPLDSGILLGTTTIQWALNPLLFALAFCGLVVCLWQGGPARMVAVTVIALTAVHVLLQAEPRYSVPYRGFEFLLAFAALGFVNSLRTRSALTPQQSSLQPTMTG